MASKTQKTDGYPLPEVIDGHELICVSLMIPNDPDYVADFRGHMAQLGQWMTWEKSGTPGDTRAARAAAYWRELLHAHLVIGDCGPTERTCTDYTPSALIVSYFPGDPFKDPDMRPFGYLFPPFLVVQSGDLINALLGYLPGDVITTLTRIPLATGGILFPGVSGWPKITIKLPTGGDLSIKLLSIESGGLAHITVDGKQVAEEDLEYLELQFPVQSTKEVDVQLTLDKGDPHTVEIRFDPKFMLTPPFLGFGGGLRSITFCTNETFNDALERAAKRLNAAYTEVDLEMPRLEVDCDCQAFIVCDDGTRKKLAFADDVPQIKAEVEGATQPKAGGGSADYCKHMTAKQRLLIPTPVNTGDIITIDNAKGAGTDGVDGAWRWINGQIYFAGLVGGDTITNSGDPVPTAPHMSLIVNVGGTFHAFTAGSFTVPGGVSNAQVYLQINTADLTIADGDYDFCTTVTNNQLAVWEQIFDLTLNSGAWAYGGVASGTPGAWVGGSGFQNNDFDPIGGGCARGVFIIRDHPSATITSIDVTYDYTLGTGGGLQAVVDVGGGNQILHNFNDVGSGSAQHFSWSGSQISTRERIYLISAFSDPCASLNGAVRVYKVRITGTGVNPYL